MFDTAFNAHTYYRASFERLGLATRLLAAHEYGAAHYFAGIAVEPMLRAHGATACRRPTGGYAQ